MKKLLFLMSFMVLVFSISSSGQNGKKYYKAGQDFVEGQKFEDAIAQFTSAIGLEPSNPDYYFSRGQVYEKLQKYNEAKTDYEKAVVFAPKNGDAYIRLGAVANRMKDYATALPLLNKASGLSKRDHEVYSEKTITLLGLGKYDVALKCSDTALIIKPAAMDYYYRGVIYTRLKNDVMANKEFEKSIEKDKTIPEPRLALAELLIDNFPQAAMTQCNEVIKMYDRNTDAYTLRSLIYKKSLDFPNAINDMSKNILIDPANAEFYLQRGVLYQEFNQHTNAIGDFSKYITMKPDSANAYFRRAKSYEEILNFEKAMEDYTKITALSEFDMKARKMLKDAQARLYELNKESNPPEISLVSPVPVRDTMEIKGDLTTVLVSGKIKEKSKLKSFTINKEAIITVEKNGEYDFLSNVNIDGLDNLTITAIDDYNNQKIISFPIKRTEIAPPEISLVAPYTTEDGTVMLDSPNPNIAIQGKITDQSLIKSIKVENYIATYLPTELNPSFSVPIDISNLNKFTVVAEDIYGNKTEKVFSLNRTGSEIAANNPMGRTWVVFIENSSYETFASLDGPVRDISAMRRAFANYQIHNIIPKKDMTKKEMEYFFNIELRDMVKKNQVKSLLVWYAGHGKFINDVGYWIPVDAKRDDEFTYFNINMLKAGLQGYSDVIVHTLVVSDACESGPGFYTAMRSSNEAPTCDNTIVAGAKSAQVFTSADTELASDNSKFTSTFANTLMNNRNACIPIETIVKTVTEAVSSDTGQKPKFGKIAGLDDMNGTFFFISK
ncbi:MAG TPA: tetratricopeptide repeat protein [Bacteroidales bacterium]|nr:tetratricopeptide repeat protein [Bacteroidales bacterium]